MKKFIIILISLLYGSVYSQTIQQTYDFAVKSMNEGNYELSIENFNRVLYFAPSFNSTETSYQLAESYKIAGEYKKSLEIYDIAYSITESDSLKKEIIFRKTELYILSDNYNFALVELFNLPLSLSKYFTSKSNFYYGVLYFQTEDFVKSYSYFAAIADSTHINYRETQYKVTLSNIFDEISDLERYNPKVTKIMSLILPGAGQLYVGDYKNAANSFGLVVASLVLFNSVAASYSLLDAYLTVFPWYQRYYLGGYKATGKITLQKRQERKSEIYKEIISLIVEYKKLSSLTPQ